MNYTTRLQRIREFLSDEPPTPTRVCHHVDEIQNFMADDYREPLFSIIAVDRQYEKIQEIVKMDGNEWEAFKKRSPKMAERLAFYRGRRFKKEGIN